MAHLATVRRPGGTFASAFGWPGEARSHEVSYATWAAAPGELAALPPAIGRAVPARQREFLAGRHCARAALAAAGVEAGLLPIGEDRLPVWPDGWRGSISHSDQGAAAVVAPVASCEAIGLDLQAWMNEADAAAVAPQIGVPEEWDLLADRAPAVATTLLFSAKEALFKALYPSVRRVLDFDAARLVARTPSAMTLMLSCDWSARWRRGMRFEVGVWTTPVQVYCGLCLSRR